MQSWLEREAREFLEVTIRVCLLVGDDRIEGKTMATGDLGHDGHEDTYKSSPQKALNPEQNCQNQPFQCSGYIYQKHTAKRSFY